MAVRLIVGAAAVSTTLFFSWMGFAVMNDGPSEMPASQPAKPRRISVRILGPASDITGITVPTHILTGQRPRFFEIEGPSVISVALPGGKVVSLPVKTAFINTQVRINTKIAVVVDVDLLPLPKAVPFRDAVAELRRILRKMDIEFDERTRKQIASLPEASRDFAYASIGVHLNEHLGLGAKVRPAPDGGYFLALTFAASVKARNVAEGTMKLATLPTDRPLDKATTSRDRGGPAARRGRELPEVSIPLLGPTRQVRGMRLHEATPKLVGYTSELLRPHRLTVRLPEGRKLSVKARGMTLLTEYGVVESIHVRPMGAAPFEKAVAEAHQAIRNLGIEPDAAMRRRMATWPKDETGAIAAMVTDEIWAGMPLGKQSRLGVYLRRDPQGGWYFLLILDATPEACGAAQAAERLATLSNIGTQFSRHPGQPAEAAGDGRSEISVPLLGPTEQVRGMEMGENVPVSPLAWPDLLRPCRLTIQLPEGRSLSMDARGAALLSNHGIIIDVLARHPSKPVPFREAVVDLHHVLKGLGIKPDEAMRQQLAQWPDNAPWTIEGSEPPDARAGISLEKAVRLDVRVCSDPRGGWYSLLNFGATKEARSALDDASQTIRGPTFKAGEKPPSEKKAKSLDQAPSD